MDDYHQSDSQSDPIEALSRLKQEELQLVSEKCSEASRIFSSTFDTQGCKIRSSAHLKIFIYSTVLTLHGMSILAYRATNGFASLMKNIIQCTLF